MLLAQPVEIHRQCSYGRDCILALAPLSSHGRIGRAKESHQNKWDVRNWETFPLVLGGIGSSYESSIVSLVFSSFFLSSFLGYDRFFSVIGPSPSFNGQSIDASKTSDLSSTIADNAGNSTCAALIP